MKQKFFYLAALALMLGFCFTGCSDDDSEQTNGSTTTVTDDDVLDVNATYLGDNLSLTYSGSAMLGKSVTFSTTDGETATLTLQGSYDITGLVADYFPEVDFSSYCPGVFPGELTTTISDVVLTQDGEKYVFEGSDSQNGRTAEYSGEVENGMLTLSIDNVVMPEDELQGTWNLNTASVLSMTWESTTGITITGLGEIPTSTIAALVPTMVNSMITGALQTISFGNDGNIVANYLESGEWTDSPLNLVQYYIGDDGQMYVQLNVAMLVNTLSTRADDGSSTPDISEFLPYLSEGVPVKYEVDGNNARLYVNKDLLLPLLSFVLGNETILNVILSAVPEDMGDLAEALLPQLVEVVNSTSEISVGLNLLK